MEQKLKEARNSGFTLIELLVVTVVIVALMGIMFRLTGIAGSASATETTVYRMQRLENCLSGYYAAFGSYPPVPLQGASRNIYRKTSEKYRWVQSNDPDDVNGESDSFNDAEVRYGIEAACRAQPVAALYPPPSSLPDPYDTSKKIGSKEAFENYRDAVKKALDSGAFTEDEEKISEWTSLEITDVSSGGSLDAYRDETSVCNFQFFRYGLMSFLLPRYLFMLDYARGRPDVANAIGNYRQWTEFNTLPAHMASGLPFESWAKFCGSMTEKDGEAKVRLIPSQAACARWMPNLENIVSGKRTTFFGIDIGESGNTGIPAVKDAADFTLYTPRKNGSSSFGTHHYPLLSYTVRDGWQRSLYYYSPAPYQSYVLWSSGKDKKTFPPWVDLSQLSEKNREIAIGWMKDDIKHMSTGK